MVFLGFSCFFMFFKSNFLTGAGHQFLPSVWEQITQVCPLPLFSSVHRFRYIEIHHHHHYSSPSSQSPSLSALYATGCQYTKHPHRSRINMFWFWTFYIILACYKITYRISLISRDTPSLMMICDFQCHRHRQNMICYIWDEEEVCGRHEMPAAEHIYWTTASSPTSWSLNCFIFPIMIIIPNLYRQQNIYWTTTSCLQLSWCPFTNHEP